MKIYSVRVEELSDRLSKRGTEREKMREKQQWFDMLIDCYTRTPYNDYLALSLLSPEFESA